MADVVTSSPLGTRLSKRFSRSGRSSRGASVASTSSGSSRKNSIFGVLGGKNRPLSTKLAKRISSKLGLTGQQEVGRVYKPKPADAQDDDEEVQVDHETYERLLQELNLEVVRLESGKDETRVPESMEDALANLRSPFRAFLREKLAGENLFFLETIEAFEQISSLAQELIKHECGDSQEDQKVAVAARQIIEDKGMEIKQKFFMENAVHQVNLSAKLNKEILAVEEKDFTADTFLKARGEISKLMEVNFFDTFCEYMEKKQRESVKSTKSSASAAPLPIFSVKAKKHAPLPSSQWRSEEDFHLAPKPVKSNRTKSWKAPLPPSPAPL